MSGSRSTEAYVCPACASSVVGHADYYECLRCARRYPVLFGIPDFRLRPDRYLSLDAERDKARRLFEASSRMSFEELLQFYYSITDDVSPARAKVFAGYVLNGPARAAVDFEDFGPISPQSALLDAGCAAGAALLAGQGRFDVVVGVDIALRWLVICQKRLQETGGQAQLVCADIEAPPFAPGLFTHVYAADLLEHVYDPSAATTSLAKQLRPGGRLWLSAINRRWIGPHPATGVWAAGLRPPRSRDGDSLRFVNHVSADDVHAFCKKAGLQAVSVQPRRVSTEPAGRSMLERGAISAYAGLSSSALLRGAMVAFGPAFQVLATKSVAEEA